MTLTNTSFSLPMPGTMGAATLSFSNGDYVSEKIGIIGLGFVGGAINDAMGRRSTTVIMDPAKGLNATYQEIKKCSGIFICVPSPQDDDGTCDTSILESVLANLTDYTGVIISKCTAPPDVYARLNAKYPTLVHAPEFLTAARASIDYADGRFAFIGGSVGAYQREAERIIRMGQRHLESVYHCTIAEAALAKYAINSFMATKVVFMNELYNVAQAAGIDYDNIAHMIKADSRIGNSHMQVPGPDGQLGFGGACFPKDTSALLKYAEGIGENMNVLDAAVKKNTLLRLTEPK
jgi:UDPglucose 6-dehydrogenase